MGVVGFLPQRTDRFWKFSRLPWLRLSRFLAWRGHPAPALPAWHDHLVAISPQQRGSFGVVSDPRQSCLENTIWNGARLAVVDCVRDGAGRNDYSTRRNDPCLRAPRPALPRL